MDSSNHDQSVDIQELSFSDSMTPHSTNLSDKIITQEKVQKTPKIKNQKKIFLTIFLKTKISKKIFPKKIPYLDDIKSNNNAFLFNDDLNHNPP